MKLVHIVLGFPVSYGLVAPLYPRMSPQLSWVTNYTAQQVQQVCSTWDSVSGSNNADVWTASGASSLLSDFLSKYGSSENGGWLNYMDRLTTSTRTGTSNVTYCHLIEGPCPPSDVDCRYFTPPGYYYIRRAATGLWTVLATIYDTILAETITNELDLPKMVQDLS